MRKLLLVIDTLAVGGAEISILEVSKRLKSFLPVVCYIYKGSTLRSDFEAAGVKVIGLGLDKKYGFPMAISRIRNVIDAEKPDIVHSVLFRAEITCRFALRNSDIPLIGSFVNDGYSTHNYRQLSTSRKIKLKLIETLDRFTAHWSDHYTSITDTIARSNCKILGIHSNKVETIYRGRAEDDYSFSLGSARNEENPVKLITVGRLIWRKGYREALEASRILKDWNVEFQYDIAGDGVDSKEIIKHARTLELEKEVYFLGYRKDIPQLLQTHDIFIFPSHYEGLGGALIEAMMAAKPIVASNIPVFKEILESEENAYFFEMKNARHLAECILEIVNNFETAVEKGKNASALATKKFNICKIVSQTEQFYDKILRQNQEIH